MKRKHLCNQPNVSEEEKIQNLKKILQQLNILYPVLYEMIVNYLNKIWKKQDFNFDFNIPLTGFIAIPDHIYVLEQNSWYILRHYNNMGNIQNQVGFHGGKVAVTIDFDEIDKVIYVQHPSMMRIFDWNLSSPRSWNFQHISKEMFGFKIDDFQNEQMFVSTMSSIWTCKKKTGELLMEWKFQDEKDQIWFRGLTIKEESIYICQYLKHEIDVIQKNTGKISTSWKNVGLVNPIRIHFDKKDQLFYVGDLYNVHLITSNGLRIEKLYSSMNEVEQVIDFSLIGNLLYLLEGGHRKYLHVWERVENSELILGE